MVGLAGNGAQYGLVCAVFDWGSPLFFVILGWVYLPAYIDSGVPVTALGMWGTRVAHPLPGCR